VERGTEVGKDIALTEANKSGSTAGASGKHGSRATRLSIVLRHSDVRKPAHYTAHDVELLLTSLWNMFTDHQAQRVMVAVPWDDSDEPVRLAVRDLAALLESWLDF